MADSKGIFLTGITGALGRGLIEEILKKTDHRLYLLIRRKQRFSHWDRARKILAPHGLEYYLGTRIEVMDGDVTRPDLGLQPDDLELLRGEVSEFYHIAALTALNGSEDECNRVNVGGTEEALKLAWDLKKNGQLKRFFYFSTAYVAGSKQVYCSLENQLPEKPAFANYYESSKYKAESKVREAVTEGLPATIFRPSIIVGDSKTGEVTEFNVIYPFMKLFAHGILSKLPTRLSNSFNIVPIDFVVQASMTIAAQEDSIGKTFHLVTQEPPTIGMLLRLKDGEYPEIPPIQVIAPDDFTKERLDENEQLVFQMLEPYLGYLNDGLTFDVSNTEEALKGTDVPLPKTDYEFLRILLRYAVDAGYLITSSTPAAT